MKELIEKGLTIDSRTIPILDRGVLENTEGSTLGLEFQTQRMEGMVSKLRETTNKNEFKGLASEYRDEIDQNKKNIEMLKSCKFM